MPRHALRFFALLAVATTPLHAAEWFVATTGNNTTGTGSAAQPFRTLNHVLSPANGIVQAGDIVTVRGPAGANTYAECEVRLRVRLTLRSPPGERAHIACGLGVPDSVAVQIDPNASGSVLTHLEISGGFYYGVFLQTYWYQGGGENERGASDVLLDDLLIHHTGRDAIKITPHSDRVTIRNSEIHHSGAIYPPGTPLDDMNAEGIDNVNGSGMVVEDNWIHHTATTCVYFKGGATDVIVQRNRLEDCGVAGVLVGFDTSPEFFDLQANPGYYEAIRGIVRNNVVRRAGYAGIGLYASRDSIVANNTIIDTATLGHAALYFGVTFQDWEPQAARPPNLNPRLANNLVIQGSGNSLRIRWSSELGGLSGLTGASGSDYNGYYRSGGNCVFADNRPGSPLAGGGTLAQWRSHANADLNSLVAPFSVDAGGHLPAGSPAIDAGSADPAVNDDIDREARVAPYDIGADEARGDVIFRHGFESVP
ncbi:MAG TPA: right-handed parallel beta-helix repeat-containing protein [Dokdonella sp.]|uniref:right-handed parallel beta-helix repeat-containing protein n=1 Tax=Dokdonella sp. TaxID=2291710 RepID=UPI0025C175B0|nr:right-handed parallel beta-helix repeat-containing protein [Dokdonella sp.]MBX3693028.1 right-handed parallel beta-helix repeat-containing protein [Dokdonella sp.]MCW5568840.1 right-handed parallel beta-helix repeat-containing protein [Dokdonella sp.]HNR91310.1 right-handed parallel beta-helix repeat-containing protein [Dokdonella sp.]